MSTAYAQMVEIACGRFQPVGNVTDGVATGELAEYHANELTPCVVTLAVFVRSGFADDFSDFLSG